VPIIAGRLTKAAPASQAERPTFTRILSVSATQHPRATRGTGMSASISDAFEERERGLQKHGRVDPTDRKQRLSNQPRRRPSDESRQVADPTKRAVRKQCGRRVDNHAEVSELDELVMNTEQGKVRQ
jgi:hypothetical protein